MRFRVKLGGHVHTDGTYYHANKPGVPSIVESDIDLVKLLGPEKFARLDDAAPAAPPAADANFEKMTVKELKDYAAANNIDLGEATLKEQIISILRDA